VLAGAAYVYFVPGSDATLRSLGINVPFPTAYGKAEVDAVSADAPAGTAAGQNGNRSQGQRAQAGGGRNGGAGGAGGFARQTPTVITAPVTTSTINDKLTAIGQGMAVQSVSVVTQATGTLEKLSVQPGATVKSGDVIGQLDDDAEKIAFDKATLAAKDATDTLQRTTTLAKTNAATAVQLAAAQLASDNAKLELRNAKLALDKRSIVTPIDGTVGLFQVTPGNAVTAQTVVTTIDDTSSILVNYWVPERYAPMIKVGMPVSALAVALPQKPFEGTVTAVDSRVDPASRTIQLQATIPNGSHAITPGMSFSVEMGFPGETYPAVDPLAIQWAADGSFVWRLTDDSKVAKDKVRIIQRNSDGVLIAGDLKPGQQVVTQGVLQISDGATVRNLSATDTAAAGDAAPATGDKSQQRAGGTAKPDGGKPAAGTAS